jgi:precorrin-2 dehydrogenase / sirohydrochlorin ferrochelatase
MGLRRSKGGTMSLFPMFLKLEGRSCLVVGAGKVAESKIRSLLMARAQVRAVAPAATPAINAWAEAGVLAWEHKPFESSDLAGTFLVVAATSSPVVNDLVFRAAQERGVLCNVVDDPERCDFYYPAVVRRGDLQIAISTAGRSPALAQRLRRDLEPQFSPGYAGWVSALGKAREVLFEQELDPNHRRRLLHEMVEKPEIEPSNHASFQEIVHER